MAKIIINQSEGSSSGCLVAFSMTKVSKKDEQQPQSCFGVGGVGGDAFGKQACLKNGIGRGGGRSRRPIGRDFLCPAFEVATVKNEQSLWVTPAACATPAVCATLE